MALPFAQNLIFALDFEKKVLLRKEFYVVFLKNRVNNMTRYKTLNAYCYVVVKYRVKAASGCCFKGPYTNYGQTATRFCDIYFSTKLKRVTVKKKLKNSKLVQTL